MKRTRIEKIKRKIKTKQYYPDINLNNNHLSWILYISKEDSESFNNNLSLYYQNNTLIGSGVVGKYDYVFFKEHHLQAASFPQISDNRIYIPMFNRNRSELLRKENLEKFVSSSAPEAKISNERIRLIYIPIFAHFLCYFSFSNALEKQKELESDTQERQLEFFREVKKQKHPIILISVNSERILKNKSFQFSSQKLADTEKKYTLDNITFSRLLKKHRKIAICYILSTTFETKKNIAIYNG